MRPLRQSIARNVMVLLVSSDDHVTGATGLTLVITSSKDGGAFAGIAPAVTERGNGWYSIALTAGMTDTLGDLALHITAVGADPLDVLFDVQEDKLASSDFIIRSGTAQDGDVSDITLDVGASAVDDLYNGLVVVIVSGLGAGQARVIFDYNGTTKLASVENAWAVVPDATSTFRLLAASHPLSMTNGGTLASYNVGRGVFNSAVDDVGIDAGTYGEMLRMLNGRMNGMMVIDNVVNGPNGMTSSRTRVFLQESNVGAATDGGVGEGEVAIYESDATYEGPGKLDVFRSRRTG